MIHRIGVGMVVLAAAGSWAALYWLVSTYPPSQPLALAGFYALLFLALATTVTLVAWSLWPAASEEEVRRPPLRYLSHGMLFSSLALFALWLQSLRMLTPLNATLLLALYAFMEVAVIVGQRTRS
ncbi:MAG: hypothetical protein HY690_13160 [Chloroflexi bacterium]|nr:hypothetical protein [Chloroflexota bacterium]